MKRLQRRLCSKCGIRHICPTGKKCSLTQTMDTPSSTTTTTTSTASAGAVADATSSANTAVTNVVTTVAPAHISTSNQMASSTNPTTSTATPPFHFSFGSSVNVQHFPGTAVTSLATGGVPGSVPSPWNVAPPPPGHTAGDPGVYPSQWPQWGQIGQVPPAPPPDGLLTTLQAINNRLTALEQRPTNPALVATSVPPSGTPDSCEQCSSGHITLDSLKQCSSDSCSGATAAQQPEAGINRLRL